MFLVKLTNRKRQFSLEIVQFLPCAQTGKDLTKQSGLNPYPFPLEKANQIT